MVVNLPGVVVGSSVVKVVVGTTAVVVVVASEVTHKTILILSVLLLAVFWLDALALSVIATATWLAGWLGGWVGGCLSQPVLYQND